MPEFLQAQGIIPSSVKVPQPPGQLTGKRKRALNEPALNTAKGSNENRSMSSKRSKAGAQPSIKKEDNDGGIGREVTIDKDRLSALEVRILFSASNRAYEPLMPFLVRIFCSN